MDDGRCGGGLELKPLLADVPPVTDLLDVFSAYDGGAIFRGLADGSGGQPAMLGRVGWIFTGFGALFVLWGFVLRTQRSGGEGKMGEIAKTWIVIAFMVAGPFLMRSAMQAAEAVYDSSVGGPRNLTAACVKAAYAMPELNQLFDVLRREALAQPGAAPGQHQSLINSADDGSVLGYVEAFGYAVWDTAAGYASGAAQTWNGMVRLAALATGFGSAMLKCLLIALTIVPLYLLLLSAAAIVWFMEQLRFFLAVSGTMMLPLFTGMFSLPEGHFSRQAAQGYVMHMVSLALWPVAWAIGHTGTIQLYNALISLIAGTSRVPEMVGLAAVELHHLGRLVGGPGARLRGRPRQLVHGKPCRAPIDPCGRHRVCPLGPDRFDPRPRVPAQDARDRRAVHGPGGGFLREAVGRCRAAGRGQGDVGRPRRRRRRPGRGSRGWRTPRGSRFGRGRVPRLFSQRRSPGCGGVDVERGALGRCFGWQALGRRATVASVPMHRFIRSASERAEGLLDRVLCVAGAILFSQVPEFMQQYLQRLEGHLDEAKLAVERFKDAARQSGMSLDQLITGASQNPDPAMGRLGGVVRTAVARVDELGAADTGPAGRVRVEPAVRVPRACRLGHRPGHPVHLPAGRADHRGGGPLRLRRDHRDTRNLPPRRPRADRPHRSQEGGVADPPGGLG